MSYRDDHHAVLLALDAAHAELRLERRRRELAVISAGVVSLGLGLVCTLDRRRSSLLPLALGATVLVVLLGLMGLLHELDPWAFNTSEAAAQRLWAVHRSLLRASLNLHLALPVASINVLTLLLAPRRRLTATAPA
jgi:hypothetical protein